MRKLILDGWKDVPVVRFSKQLFKHHFKINCILSFMYTYNGRMLEDMQPVCMAVDFTLRITDRGVISISDTSISLQESDQLHAALTQYCWNEFSNGS